MSTRPYPRNSNSMVGFTWIRPFNRSAGLRPAGTLALQMIGHLPAIPVPGLLTHDFFWLDLVGFGRINFTMVGSKIRNLRPAVPVRARARLNGSIQDIQTRARRFRFPTSAFTFPMSKNNLQPATCNHYIMAPPTTPLRRASDFKFFFRRKSLCQRHNWKLARHVVSGNTPNISPS
jgi:hypothetical protein